LHHASVAYHDKAWSMLSYFERTWSESNVVFRTSRRGHRSRYASSEAFEHEFGHEYLDLALNLTNVICSEPHVAAGAEVARTDATPYPRLSFSAPPESALASGQDQSRSLVA
jgi:hypothetical protein